VSKKVGMSSAYALWKTAHIVSATILFGTGLGTAFFCWFGSRHALRTGEIGALRTILRLTVRADYCFTAPAVVFQLVSGIVLMWLLGWPLVSPWSIAVMALFVLAGACWLPVVVLQTRLSGTAARANSIKELPDAFRRQFRWWVALGMPAFSAVLALFFLMVAKPLAVAGS
jgi:uncharacterized membrane protein